MSTIRCPFCSYTRSWNIRRSKKKCKQCRKEFAPNMYPVARIRATGQEWRLCIKIFLRERTIHSIVVSTEIGHCKVEKMVQHLRNTMYQDLPATFKGPIEMDETYIGGQRKNKRLHIRKIQAKRGHGTEKLPIVGLFDRFSGCGYIAVEPKKLDMSFILTVLKERVAPCATLYTDGYKMYRMLKKKGYDHEYVDHDGGELVRGEIHTNNIEGFWGILKRKLSCIGGMRRDRLYLFVAEIAWKFNHRKQSLSEQEAQLLALIADEGIGG